jgi:hypothetical protein
MHGYITLTTSFAPPGQALESGFVTVAETSSLI